MDSIFQIGSFPFRLRCPEEVQPPENFMKFICEESAGTWPEYTYEIRVADALPMPEPDLVVFREENGLEARLIGVKGRPDPYACYRELSEERAQTVLLAEEIRELHIDPLFSSLLALERRLIRKDEMVLHCESIPIRAVVMLSQEKENRAERMTPGQAFPLLYSQITVNKWNAEDHVHTLDLIDSFLGEVPVYQRWSAWQRHSGLPFKAKGSIIVP